jgi:hypothetical protein
MFLNENSTVYNFYDVVQANKTLARKIDATG